MNTSTRSEWFQELASQFEGKLPNLIYRGQGTDFSLAQGKTDDFAINFGEHLYVAKFEVWAVATTGSPTTWPYTVAMGIPEGWPWLGKDARLVARQEVNGGAWVARFEWPWPRLIGFSGGASQKTLNVTVANTLNSTTDIKGFLWVEGYQIIRGSLPRLEG